MNRICLFTFTLFSAFPLLSADTVQTGFPFQDESLRYNITYSNGLPLGEATLTARKTAKGWDFAAGVDVNVAGFRVKDKYTSAMATGYCSTEFKRDTLHGSKAGREKSTFDQDKQTVHRLTELPNDGGVTDMKAQPCSRDAISFLYFARKELGQGRVAPPEYVYFGSTYLVKQNYTGAQSITIGEGKKPETTDHLVFSVKGPKAEFTVEVNYARDAARTPLLIKIPQAAGTLTMELVR